MQQRLEGTPSLSIVRNQRRVPLRRAILALALGAPLLWPAVAGADCVRSGDVVTCTGVDPDGFPDAPDDRPASDDGLEITVESGAVVENSGGADSIELLYDNEVIVQANGTVTAAGGAAAIFGQSDSQSSLSRHDAVDNAGSITASGTGGRGVDLASYGEVANQETGSVTLLGVDDGVGIRVGSNGRVENAGQVQVTGSNAVGISATNVGSVVITSPTSEVSVGGANAVGIDAWELVHDGTTTVTGDGTVGLRVRGTGSAASRNDGSIIVTGDDAIGLRVDARGTATNYGLVQVDGTGAVGLSGTATSLGSTTLENPGTVVVTGTGSTAAVAGAGTTVRNSGLLEASGTDAVGVLLDGNRALVINDGTIRGGDGSGVAARFADPAPGAADIKELYNQEGGLLEAQSGVAVLGSSGRERVLNRGQIQGDVLLGGDDDNYTWGDRSALAGSLDGGDGVDILQLFQSDPNVPVDDSFDLGSATSFEGLAVGFGGDSGTWTLTGSGSYPEGLVLVDGELRIDPGAGVQDELRVVGGVLHLDDGVSLPAGVQASAGRTVFSAGASVAADLAVSDTARLGLDGDAALQGDLSLEGGTYESSFDAAGNGPSLQVTGDLLLGGGSVLELQQSDAGTVAGEPVLRVLSATGARSGRFGDVRVDGSDPFLRGLPIYGTAAGADVVDVQLTSRFQPFARSRSQARIAQYLDVAVAQGPGPELQSFLDTLAPLSNGELPGAYDALHGAVYDAHTSTAFATAGVYLDLLATRPLRCEQLTSAHGRRPPSRSPCGERGLTPWVEATGAFVKRDGDRGYEDWSSAGGGVAFGADQRLGGDWIVSGLLGASRSGLDLDEDGDGSYTSFEAGIAAAWSRGGAHVRAALEYGHGWHTTHRQVSVPGYSQLALADHDSDRVSALAGGGYSFLFLPFEVEPTASLEYSWLRERKIDETNAGPVRLDIRARENVLVATDAGLRVGATLVKEAYLGPLLEWADGIWRPEIHGGWRQVWNDYDRHLSARLRSAPPGTGRYRVRSEDAQYGARFGAGVSFQPQGTRNHVSVEYDGFQGDGTTSHTVMATLRIPF